MSTIVRVSYDTECGGTTKPTPDAHATSHKTGGSDAVKLDELAAPTDVTTLNVSSTAHGLAPKHPNDATKFLSGAATYLALDQLHVAGNVVALTPGTTVAWDASLGNAGTLTPGQDETINASLWLQRHRRWRRLRTRRSSPMERRAIPQDHRFGGSLRSPFRGAPPHPDAPGYPRRLAGRPQERQRARQPTRELAPRYYAAKWSEPAASLRRQVQPLPGCVVAYSARKVDSHHSRNPPSGTVRSAGSPRLLRFGGAGGARLRRRRHSLLRRVRRPELYGVTS